MSIKIQLDGNHGFEWIKSENAYVKGYGFDSNGIFYTGEKLLNYFNDFRDKKEFINKLEEINGSFAVVIIKNHNVYLAVDRVRSIPLYYSMKGEKILVSDNAQWIKEQLNVVEINSISLLEFQLTGYTVGDSTLFKEIKQVQAGECTSIKIQEEKNIANDSYYTHLHCNYLDNDKEELYQLLDNISENIFRRLVTSVNNRTIVVPLSGGYDSRYIVAMLKKMNYKNVICYTYGRPDSHEVRISRQVAEKLGFEWHYIEYDTETWERFSDEDMKEYLKFSHNFSSLPHIQDFFAVEYLTKNEIIPKNSILVPGYCGDLLGGSYLINEEKLNSIDSTQESLAEYIFKTHFNLFKYNGKDSNEIIDNISNVIKQFNIKDKHDLVSINEHFFTCHKVAKFVVNSLRVYEYWGYEWRMPLWDNELIEFWYKVPNFYRVNNELYNDFLFRNIFDIYDISILKEKPKPSIIVNIKHIIPKPVEKIIIYVINKYLFRKKRNFNGFNELAEKLAKDIRNNRFIENIYINQNFNHVYAVWFYEKFLKA